MYKFMVILAFVFCMNAHSQSECDAILANGIFNKSVLEKENTNNEAFKDILISLEYSTVNEIQNKGVDVFAILKGIPVGGKGQVSENNFNEWKKEYLKQKKTVIDHREVIKKFKTSIDPNVVNAWLKCIEKPRHGLSLELCLIDSEYAHAAIRWYKDGEARQPVIENIVIVGGSIEYENFKSGYRIGYGITPILIRVDKNAPLVSLDIYTTDGNLSQRISKRKPHLVSSATVSIAADTKGTIEFPEPVKHAWIQVFDNIERCGMAKIVDVQEKKVSYDAKIVSAGFQFQIFAVHSPDLEIEKAVLWMDPTKQTKKSSHTFSFSPELCWIHVSEGMNQIETAEIECIDGKKVFYNMKKLEGNISSKIVYTIIAARSSSNLQIAKEKIKVIPGQQFVKGTHKFGFDIHHAFAQPYDNFERLESTKISIKGKKI